MTESDPRDDDVYPLRVHIRGQFLRKLRDKALADRRDLSTYAAMVLERDAGRPLRKPRAEPAA